MTKDGKRETILAKFGALHGQEVQARVSFAKQAHNMQVYNYFFGVQKAVFDVSLRCNDNKQNQWEVVRMKRCNDE